MSDTELHTRPLSLNDIPAAIEIVRAAWAFGEMAEEIGRLTTAGHYVIDNLRRSNIGFALDLSDETTQETTLAGFLVGYIPGLPVPGLLDTSEGRRWADNIESLWLSHTSESEREIWAHEWFSGEKAADALAAAEGRLPSDPSRLLLFAVADSARGRGIGSALYRAFWQAHTAFNGRRALTLHTDTWCGWRFYEKNGFTRLAEVRVYDEDMPNPTPDASLGAFFLYAKMP